MNKWKIILICFTILMALTLAINVQAGSGSNWPNWAGDNLRSMFVGDGYLAFGSNYPLYGEFSHNKSVSIGLDFTPLVDDLNNDGNNEIIAMSSNVLYVYNNELDLVDSLTLSGTTKKACITNYNNDNYPDLLLMNGSKVVVVNLINSQLEIEKQILVNYAYTSIECDNAGWNGGKAGAVYSNGIKNASIVSWVTGEIIDVLHFNYNIPGNSVTAYESKSVTSGNIQGIGNYQIVFITSNLANYNWYGYLYDLNDHAYVYSAVIVEGDPPEKDSITIVNAQLSGGSDKSLLVSVSDTSSTKRAYYILDSTFSVKSSYYNAGDSNVINNNFMVADINYDGSNEACINNFKQQRLKCYNYLGINITDYNTPFGDAESFYFSTLGEYSGGSPLELLTPYGIYSYDGTNFTLSNGLGLTFDTLGLIYPVRIHSAPLYAKDILYSNNGLIETFYSDIPVVCGDGVCSTTENILNCPEDCGVTGTKDAILGTITINPPTSSAWKNNTNVEVNIQAKSKSSGNGGARAVLYQGSVYAIDSGRVNGTINATYTFSFKANQTMTSSFLRVYAYSQVDGTSDWKDIGISVAENGLSYGDGYTTFNGATTTTNTSIGQQPNTEDNSAKKFLDIFSSTGLGYLALWLIFMVIVGLSILFVGYQYHMQPNYIFWLIIMIEAIMFILGAVFQFIPVGVIITIVVIAIGVIALKWRNATTGG